MTPSASSPLSIRLQNCAKTFANGAHALHPLNLEIAAGETLVLLGPSGCGKTTTLRMIAGLEMPDAGGKVFFDDEDVTALGIEARHVGMVFQSYALFPNMSVAENVGYGLRLRKTPTPRLRERVREMLAMMRIEALADRRIDQLSGGQRQRVALARALAVRPRALLLDEPLTALDARLRDALRIEINALLRELGITAIYVTHDQTEAMALGDRIIVMSHGRIEQAGTPREIYHAPASAFVADFIGSMNCVRGTLGAEGLIHAGTAPGSREFFFRPEDASIASENEAADLCGMVAASFFLGDHTRLLVDIGDAAPAALIIKSEARCTRRSGEQVRLKINPSGLLSL